MSSPDWTMAHASVGAHLPTAFRSACSGTLRVVEDDGKRPALLECDECGEAVTVRQSVIRGVPPARPTESMPFAPSIL